MKKKNGFMALVNRTNLLNRWQLMRCHKEETVSEHSFQVAVIAHQLCAISRTYAPGIVLNSEGIIILALYHDIEEVMLGDMPTPVKYSCRKMTESYEDLADTAKQNIMSTMPEALCPQLSSDCFGDRLSDADHFIVKASDKLSAYIKAKEELNDGNRDFRSAYSSIVESLEDFSAKSTALFGVDLIKLFNDFYDDTWGLTLDELC